VVGVGRGRWTHRTWSLARVAAGDAVVAVACTPGAGHGRPLLGVKTKHAIDECTARIMLERRGVAHLTRSRGRWPGAGGRADRWATVGSPDRGSPKAGVERLPRPRLRLSYFSNCFRRNLQQRLRTQAVSSSYISSSAGLDTYHVGSSVLVACRELVQWAREREGGGARLTTGAGLTRASFAPLKSSLCHLQRPRQ